MAFTVQPDTKLGQLGHDKIRKDLKSNVHMCQITNHTDQMFLGSHASLIFLWVQYPPLRAFFYLQIYEQIVIVFGNTHTWSLPPPILIL